MLLRVLSFAALWAISCALTVSNIDSIRKQVHARDVPYGSVLDDTIAALSLEEKDFIDQHLNELQKYNGTSCEKCHHKVIYAQDLVNENPDKSHLISLMLYEYCLVQNKNKDTKCEFIDFFITTNTYTNPENNAFSGPAGGFEGATSISFFDNDFIQMIKNFNTSSKLSLDYYCHYKGSYCKLPETPDLASIIDLDSMWPAKEEEYFSEPQYNATRERFNVLHVSDFHNELRYQIGAEANCSQGLCCLPESYNSDLTDKSYNFTSVYEDAGASGELDLSFYPHAHYDENDAYVAGEYYDIPLYRGWSFAWTPASTFGNYECDPPEVLLNNSLLHIGGTIPTNKYEFSLFTGDIVDHDVIHCDANTTKFAEIRSYKIMKHFLKDIPVYPTLGNHDTFPYGQLAPQNIGNVSLNESVYHWNDELMSELWTSNGWLDESEKDEIKQHYSAFTTTTNRGLKVISLNSNCYYQKNLYAYINMEAEPDLFGQWQYLIDELVESEKNGQRVWILAHIPAGDQDALPIQSDIFAKIVERFSPYTIANIFSGHTHKDQFKVLYDSNSNPINMAWVSQAITPLGPANPSWRYYEVEDESFNIMNAYNYYSPLNETWVSASAEPKWLYEYDPRTTYDTEGKWPGSSPLNASFWDQFVVQRLKDQSDIEFNQLYTNLLYRNNPYVPSCANNSKITDDCYTSNYCDIIGFKVDDYNKCVQ
ncbi:Calcineurin-like phosphoesterase family protein [Clavispora lusitaniae]|uniref:Calcineurin-like phosphoesterase family protein n=1 Tax=Clavispora lusitaniae TaxID=36911 RepID=UPI00202BEA65|nr:Calcineurin-like phosphoesterase family protein [Clavispora lusitaniae]